MATPYVLGLKEAVEFWKDMNPNKGIHLLDLDKLVTIMRRYYVMYPKKETQNTGKVTE